MGRFSGMHPTYLWTFTPVDVSTGTATNTVTTDILIPSKSAKIVKMTVYQRTAGTGTAIFTVTARERGGATDRTGGLACTLAAAANTIFVSDGISGSGVSFAGSTDVPDASEGDRVDLVFTKDAGSASVAANVRVGILWMV